MYSLYYHCTSLLIFKCNNMINITLTDQQIIDFAQTLLIFAQIIFMCGVLSEIKKNK